MRVKNTISPGNCYLWSFTDSFIWTRTSSGPGPWLHDAMSSERPRLCPQRLCPPSCSAWEGAGFLPGWGAGVLRGAPAWPSRGSKAFRGATSWNLFSLLFWVNFNSYFITSVVFKIHTSKYILRVCTSSLCFVGSQILSSADIPIASMCLFCVGSRDKIWVLV